MKNNIIIVLLSVTLLLGIGNCYHLNTIKLECKRVTEMVQVMGIPTIVEKGYVCKEQPRLFFDNWFKS